MIDVLMFDSGDAGDADKTCSAPRRKTKHARPPPDASSASAVAMRGGLFSCRRVSGPSGLGQTVGSVGPTGPQ